MGMAFTDVVLTETDATVTIVDRRGRPGGHWNDAYPFVRLHQPSAFYGVNSTDLGSGTRDEVGWNHGLYELASGTEVVSYFDQVLHQRFLPSGRVSHLPMCEYRGDGAALNLVSGVEHHIRARRVVDATHMNVSVPSTHPPSYEVGDGLRCVPLNDLPRVEAPPDGFTIIGGGKTAMDACLWLLATGVDPDAIRWIRPRDSWLLDRANIQPLDLFDTTIEAFATQTEQIAAARSIDDLFDRLEQAGSLLRIDPEVRPTMYRCATVTRDELDQLRRIENVVRLGRVARIGSPSAGSAESAESAGPEIELTEGTIPTTADTLHVDCSADGLTRLPERPVFDGDRITLQPVRTCQQVFSAAFIAHVATAYDDEAEQNELCTVVSHPDTDVDYLRVTLRSSLNGVRWRQDAELSRWLDASRLNGFGRAVGTPGREVLAAVRRLAEATPGSIETLSRLLADMDQT